MEIECDKCGFIINRDKYINGKLVEEYFNKYGTNCPKCKNIIKPIKSLKDIEKIEEKELKLKEFQNIMRNKIREKINKETKKCL